MGRPADLPTLENAATPSGSLGQRHTPESRGHPRRDPGHAPHRRPALGRSLRPDTRQWALRLRAGERGAGRSGPPEGAGQEGAALLRPRAGEYGAGVARRVRVGARLVPQAAGG
ncbi:unnamed protein product [Rangifer tarandus platyrhynchus]|uniref:Uncharacterized protein n=2 Tax=Rangifer tarandus platyrhynchus TaxID=3082113 RepID=A0ACB0E2Z9_RANTA|nr:unnamed protein product [Rangifer tarandus platyrhynchus]CAI9694886.1 unnamed protein product [Rangifer tarandus platyrhynchus]